MLRKNRAGRSIRNRRRSFRKKAVRPELVERAVLEAQKAWWETRYAKLSSQASERKENEAVGGPQMGLQC
jgi:hypothetical protein